jgi:hypothetical protein
MHVSSNLSHNNIPRSVADRIKILAINDANVATNNVVDGLDDSTILKDGILRYF